MEIGYSQHSRVDGDFVDESGNPTELPETRVVYFYSGAVVNWSF